MTDVANDILHRTDDDHSEFRTLMSFDLLLVVLSAVCLLLGEMRLLQSTASTGGEVAGSLLDTAFSLAAPLTASLGCIAAFLAFRIANDKLISDQGFLISLPAVPLLLLCGLGLHVAGNATGWLLASAGTIALFVQWTRLALPFLTHRYTVFTLMSASLAAGILCCFSVGMSDWRIYAGLSLLFGMCSLFIHALALKTHAPSQLSLPSKRENDELSNISRSTFAPAITDGFLLGVCLTYMGLDSFNGGMPGLELGIALIASACANSLQVVPKLRYEAFMRSHASCFKLMPLLALILFKPMCESLANTLSLAVVLIYVLFLVTSLCDRMAFLELSPFCTFGSHGAVFFSAGIAGICSTPLLLQTAFAGSISGALVLFIAAVAMEWILVRTYSRKSYLSLPLSSASDASMQGEGASGHGKDMGRPGEGVEDNPGVSAPVPQWSDCVRAASKCYELSARQEEVLFLLAKGRTAQFIAEKLTITPATAKSHIYNIYLKFGVHSQQELLDVLESMKDKLDLR